MRIGPLLVLVICASLAGSVAGQNQEWHRYRNDAGNFSVLMPVQPTETAGEGGGSHTIEAISGGIGYTVVYVYNNAEQRVDQPTYNSYRDSFLKGLPNCRQAGEYSASPPITGYIGGWYRMNCNVENTQMTFAGNLYWGKHYAYAVMVMFPTSPSDPPATRKFTDSFDVLVR
jgi:hypothetical protein